MILKKECLSTHSWCMQPIIPVGDKTIQWTGLGEMRWVPCLGATFKEALPTHILENEALLKYCLLDTHRVLLWSQPCLPPHPVTALPKN